MGDYREPYMNYIEVYHNEDQGYWIGFVYNAEQYVHFQEAPEGGGAELNAIDVFSALDEVTLLSRIKTNYPAPAIGYTDGQVRDLPW
jgi:hypothetical protein